MFAHPKRKHLLLSLINSILAYAGEPLLPDFEPLDRELDAHFYKGKSGRVDILGCSSDETVVNIEFQIEKLLYMGERSVFYWTCIYRLYKGQEYYDLHRTLCINILAFDISDEEKIPNFCNTYAILNKKHPTNTLTTTFEMHFIELPKWERQRKYGIHMTLLEKWLAYFSSKTDETELQKIAAETPEIAEALNVEEEFMASADLRNAYDAVEKDRRDAVAHEAYFRNEGFQDGEKKGFQDGEKKGFQDGEKKGFQDGFQNGQRGLISTMIRNGISLESISQMTGMALGEVRTLAMQIQ